jgi:hypothetical protein
MCERFDNSDRTSWCECQECGRFWSPRVATIYPSPWKEWGCPSCGSDFNYSIGGNNTFKVKGLKVKRDTDAKADDNKLDGAFNIYCIEQTEALRHQYPAICTDELFKRIVAGWNRLTDEQRSDYLSVAGWGQHKKKEEDQKK